MSRCRPTQSAFAQESASNRILSLSATGGSTGRCCLLFLYVGCGRSPGSSCRRGRPTTALPGAQAPPKSRWSITAQQLGQTAPFALRQTSSQARCQLVRRSALHQARLRIRRPGFGELKLWIKSPTAHQDAPNHKTGAANLLEETAFSIQPLRVWMLPRISDGIWTRDLPPIQGGPRFLPSLGPFRKNTGRILPQRCVAGMRSSAAKPQPNSTSKLWLQFTLWVCLCALIAFL